MTWLRRIRFSLRTLVLGVLLIGSGMGLWWRWEPWHVTAELRGHTFGDGAREFSPDGTRIVTGGGDATCQIWDTGTGKALHVFRASRRRVRHVAFSRQADRIVTVAGGWFEEPDTVVQVWDAATGSCITTIGPEKESVHKVVFSADGRFVIDDESCMWDATTGSLRLDLRGAWKDDKDLEAKDTALMSKATSLDDLKGVFLWSRKSPCGAKILTQSQDLICVWDTASFEKITEFRVPGFSIGGAVFSPDGRVVASVSYDPPRTIIRNATTGAPLGDIARPLIAMSRWPGRALLHIEHNETGVWDVQAQKTLCVLKDVTLGTAISPDGTRLLATPMSSAFPPLSKTGLYDAETGHLLAHLMKSMQCAVISPDGRRLLADSGGVSMIWSRRRPEYWWGIAWLPEFWLTLVFAAGLVWSMWRDRRILRPLRAPAEPIANSQ